jgi:hypothetical protein
MRHFLSLILALTILARQVEADTPAISAQIAAIPLGAKIELRMKTNEKLRGSKGTASDIGFTLVNPPAADRQIAFDDVTSVKLYKSHTTRNVLIIVGIGVVATVGILAAVILRCAPLGCNSKL